MTACSSVVQLHRLVVSLAVVAASLAGCGSGKSGGVDAGGRGGVPGTGGAGSGGTMATGGIAGTGGAGAGGVDAAAMSLGGSGGNATGGVVSGGAGGRGGSGGVGAGGMDTGGPGTGGRGLDAGGPGTGGRGLDAGPCPSGQMWCPGCAPGTGSCGAACPSIVCYGLDGGSADTLTSQDVPQSCSQLKTREACDQRNDCHSVNFDQGTCGCATPGCCVKFDHCDDGGTVACEGRVTCSSATPSCEGPYAVQYQSSCFNGCVAASKCTAAASCPLAAPVNGVSCGSTPLSCAYQDCAGAGRTQATCKGGVWTVQTASCDSIKCAGGGTFTGYVLCGPDQICVRTTSGGGAYTVTPSCIANTCAPAAISAQCVNLSSNCSVSGSGISCSQPSSCGSGMGGCQ